MARSSRSRRRAAITLAASSSCRSRRWKRTLTSPPPGTPATMLRPFPPTVEASRSIGSARTVESHVVSTAGGDPRRVTQEQHLWLQRLAWTPTGHELVFSSGRGGPESSSSLWRVSAAGGTARAARGGRRQRGESGSVTSRRASRLRAAPDGCKYLEDRRAAVDTTGLFALPADCVHAARGWPPIFTGRRQNRLPLRSHGSNELWLCDAAGSNLVQLTSFGGALVGTPRWAPDGRRLVFDVSANGNSDIHVIDVEGGLPRRVTTEPFAEVVPSWSRRTMDLLRLESHGRFEVWKMPCRRRGLDPDHKTRWIRSLRIERRPDPVLREGRGE